MRRLRLDPGLRCHGNRIPALGRDRLLIGLRHRSRRRRAGDQLLRDIGAGGAPALRRCLDRSGERADGWGWSDHARSGHTRLGYARSGHGRLGRRIAASIAGLHAILPGMRERGRGQVVLVSWL